MNFGNEKIVDRRSERDPMILSEENIYNFSMKLKENYGDSVSVNENLAPYTTYRVGGPATVLAQPESLEQFGEMLKVCALAGLPIFILGGGSNLLISDKGLKKVVFKLDNCCSNIYHSGDEVHTGAGAKISDLVLYCEQNELAGLEFMSGIPGSVGGALRMNAGAFIGEIGDVIIHIDALTNSGETIRISRNDAGFGYRRATKLREKILTGCLLKLHHGDAKALFQSRESYIQKRANKQPLDYGSCGSVFKRPQGNYAGTLIEKAGCKGMRIGDAMVSEKHANFIVNLGKATASDIFQLLLSVQKTVMQKFSIWLEPEVKIVGFSEQELKQLRNDR